MTVLDSKKRLKRWVRNPIGTTSPQQNGLESIPTTKPWKTSLVGMTPQKFSSGGNPRGRRQAGTRLCLDGRQPPLMTGGSGTPAPLRDSPASILLVLRRHVSTAGLPWRQLVA